MSTQIFKIIPGYEPYMISPEGQVVNSKGHVLKPYQSKAGEMVELHCNGQRERLLISQLIEQTYGGSDENKGCIEDRSEGSQGTAS